MYHFGQEGLHNVLVIDLLGPNLEELFDMCDRKFTVKTVCMLAIQMVRGFVCAIVSSRLILAAALLHRFPASRVCTTRIASTGTSSLTTFSSGWVATQAPYISSVSRFFLLRSLCVAARPTDDDVTLCFPRRLWHGKTVSRPQNETAHSVSRT